MRHQDATMIIRAPTLQVAALRMVAHAPKGASLTSLLTLLRRV
jgi:hypothetical protein